MTGSWTALAAGTVLYLAVLAVLGVRAARRSSESPEEYFLAGRGLGKVVLFMALFGTNCTTFVLVAIPAVAWEHGVGVFGLNAAVVAMGVPLTFLFIGLPARREAERLGAVTPAELYARKLDSRSVGLVLFVLFTVYTIPYMVQGVRGTSLVLASATEGALPAWGAALALLLIVFLYTSLGGMRGTAWTNVFQGALFLVFMLAAFVVIPARMGGLSVAMERVREIDEDLLRVGGDYALFQPAAWASWGLVISTTVIAFPHMLVRLLSSASDDTTRTVCRFYPLALVLLWVPAVLLGVVARGAVPDLERPDLVFSVLARDYLPIWLGSFAFLAILAATMSTLDAQVLTLSSMLLRDFIEPFFLGARRVLDARTEVAIGRSFTLLVAATVFVLSLTWGESLFEISRRSFEGYTTLVPTLFLGVQWSRFRAAGALASMAAGNAYLWLAWTTGAMDWGGFLPVFWAFVVAFATGVLVSLAVPAPASRGPRGSS